MKEQLLRIKGDDNVEIAIALRPSRDDDGERVVANDLHDAAVKTVDQALGGVLAFGRGFMSKLEALKPQEAAVEFGVEFKGSVGAIIASTSTEAHVKVTLKWTQPHEATGTA